MTRGRLGLTALAIAGALVLGETVFAWSAGRRQADLLGTPVVPARVVPSIVLTNERGDSVAFHDPLYRATFVFFGYTRCRDTCPIALAVLAKAYRELDAPNDVRVEMVTVDPARDDPAQLEFFVHRFSRAFRGLTGERKVLAQLYGRFEIKVDARTNEVEHGSSIFLVDDGGRVVTMYPPDAAPAILVHDARVLLGKL